MPSPAALIFVAKLVAFVALAYTLSLGRWPSLRGIAAFILLLVGAIGCYDGFTLAVREDARRRDGTVLPGVVVEKYTTDGRGHTYSTRGREGPHPGVSGFLLTEAIAHRIAYGSFAIRIVDYRYPCGLGSGTCLGRDRVSPELWDRLEVGKAVNVRQAEGETRTARLDENPQFAMAIAQLAISALVLVAAAWLSGRFKRSRRTYVTAPAVVTAVEQVNYRNDTRWKVRFAYFDEHNNAQESADEVSRPTWKAGDDCIAVYQRETPDLATLRAAQ